MLVPVQTHDARLMKLLRNISEHSNSEGFSARQLLVRHTHELAGMVVNARGDDFLVEAAGCLANVTVVASSPARPGLRQGVDQG